MISYVFSILTILMPSILLAQNNPRITTSIGATSQPVDKIYPGYRNLDYDVWYDSDVQVLNSTIDPTGKAFIKVCKVGKCEGRENQKWVPYKNDIGDTTIKGLKIGYRTDDRGVIKEANSSTMPKYTPWNELNLSKEIRNYYHRRTQYKEELRDTTDPTRNRIKCAEDGLEDLQNTAASALNPFDLFDGEKNWDELLAYLEHHQKDKDHCGPDPDHGKDFQNYLNKYKHYIDSAGKVFFRNAGSMNNAVFFTCMTFQESLFENTANSSGYYGLGQMGNLAIEDTRQKINKEGSDTNRLYREYMSSLQQSDCPKNNSNGLMPGHSLQKLKHAMLTCPDIGVAASAVYVNILQEDIKRELGYRKISNFEMYQLTAIAYNGGRGNLIRILRNGMKKGKTNEEMITTAIDAVDEKGNPLFSDAKKVEIENYRYSIRNCMEKGNFNPKCGNNWDKIRKSSLRCFKEKHKNKFKIDPRKSRLPCPETK